RGSRRSEGSGTGSAMPDGTKLVTAEVAEDAAVAEDARLIAGVGRRLVLWAAGTTLVVLVVLGFALYASVSQSLATRRLPELDALISGGGTPGTVALILDAKGAPILPRNLRAMAGLPDAASLAAAQEGGRDVR